MKAPRDRETSLGILCRVGAMFCMAALYALVKVCSERGAPVFQIVLFRNALAFIPLGFYVWRSGERQILKTARPLAHVKRSITGLIGMICGFAAVRHLPLTEATAIQFASPLFMTALSAAFLGEKVGIHRWGAIAVGFIGVLIMVRPDAGQINLLGAGLALGAAFGTASAMVSIRQMAGLERGSTIVFYFTLTGAVLGLVGSVFEWAPPDTVTLALLVCVGLIGGVAQLLLTQALRLAPVGVLAPFDYTQLVWASLLGFALWGESPRPATLCGAVVVTLSGLYILYREIRLGRQGRP